MTFVMVGCSSRHGRDRMLVGFTTTYEIGAYHQLCWVRVPLSGGGGGGLQHYIIKFVSDLRGRSVVFTGFSGFLHQ
jgi:hypothetical protein